MVQRYPFQYLETRIMIKVVICDDHQLFREGLNLILSGIDDVNMVDQFKDGQEVLDWLKKTQSRCDIDGYQYAEN